jgi:hypothetical protein
MSEETITRLRRYLQSVIWTLFILFIVYAAKLTAHQKGQFIALSNNCAFLKF